MFIYYKNKNNLNFKIEREDNQTGVYNINLYFNRL